MSNKSLGIAFAAALTFGGFALSSAPAAATPLLDPGLSRAAQSERAKPEQARIVCNRWGRCWHRPNRWGPRWGWRHHGWRGRHHGWRHHRGGRHHRR